MREGSRRSDQRVNRKGAFDFRAPRKIAAPPRTPQNRLRMILLRSRFDSWTFTPMMSAIDSESNFSRCPSVVSPHLNQPRAFEACPSGLNAQTLAPCLFEIICCRQWLGFQSGTHLANYLGTRLLHCEASHDARDSGHG
jgi:hypothetical protein